MSNFPDYIGLDPASVKRSSDDTHISADIVSNKGDKVGIIICKHERNVDASIKTDGLVFMDQVSDRFQLWDYVVNTNPEIIEQFVGWKDDNI